MSMQPEVAGLVLLAAAMHAVWNALVKAGGDRLLTQAVILGAGALLGAAALPFAAPPAPASWPYLALSTAVHTGYYACLLRAYHHGDLSQVYPLARGSAPLLVAALSAPLAGEMPRGTELPGLALVSLGVASLALGGARPRPADARAATFALGTGACIAAYTLCDGLGVRASGQPLGYIVWLMLLDGLPLCAFAALRRGRSLGPALRAAWRPGVVGGVLASVAYGIAIWAMGVAPMAQVSALRETGVVMAALIGTLVMGEPFGARRVAAAAVVAAGIALLAIPG